MTKYVKRLSWCQAPSRVPGKHIFHDFIQGDSLRSSQTLKHQGQCPHRNSRQGLLAGVTTTGKRTGSEGRFFKPGEMQL